MEINIVIKTGNLYEEINKNINYILSKINKKINIIFVSYDSKCNQNLVYESYGEYENIKVVKYKNYNYGFIKNFIISLKLCKYITFLDINNIKEINDISKIYTDNEDILILDLENKTVIKIKNNAIPKIISKINNKTASCSTSCEASKFLV